MPRNYRSRETCYVPIKMGNTTISYGFPSGLLQSLRDDFGQTVLGTNLPTGFVFGANSPKPRRASKRLAAGYVSSYCSDAKASELKKKGYKLTAKKVRSAINTGISKTVYVTIGGIKYAWNQPSFVGSPPDSYNQLGVKDASNSDVDLVFGATFPKPPRFAFEQVISETETNVISTFIDPTKGESAGNAKWVSVQAARYYPL